MSQVFVAFLDILGFKELVERNPQSKLDSIYSSILEVIDDVHSRNKNIRETILPKLNLEIVNISDSIVLTTSDDSFESFFVLVHAVRKMLTTFLRKGVPLRGAITNGTVSTIKRENQTNVYGKAITDAFRMEGMIQLSGCLVSESCLELIKSKDESRLINSIFSKNLLIEYEVPKKTGVIKKEILVNWVIKAFSEEIIRKYFSMHNKNVNDWSVEAKIVNTIKFVHYVDSINALVDYFIKKKAN